MRQIGNKAVARALMDAAGLPLLPGTVEPVDDAAEGARVAAEIGYPVIIKAAAGGGGRGLAVVTDPGRFAETFGRTRAAAKAVFRDPTVYVERFLTGARHVEIQLVCDEHGGGVHLGDRDCSTQRRHQKLIEEAPSGVLSPDLRAEIGAAALRGARSVGYTGAGTVEFLLDDDGRFYFMEINARIQVEHPVTEMVTGVDLVREQILVAGGRPLSVKQEDVAITGAAIECRVNAEDPDRDFAPSPGRLHEFRPPSGPWTRVDSGYASGMAVTPHYDSLLAKVIVWAPDRSAALDRMDRALEEFQVGGVATTIDFHRSILNDPVFRAGDHTIHFVDDFTRRRRTGDHEQANKRTSERCYLMPEEFTMHDLMEILVMETGLSRDVVTDDPSATFADVGLDSLAFLQLQTVIDNRHGLELADDRRDDTFGTIIDLVNEARSEQVGRA